MIAVATIGVLLALHPEVAALAMLIFIMAGLPALYRLRGHFRPGSTPPPTTSSRKDSHETVESS